MYRSFEVYLSAFKASLQAKLEYRADLAIGMGTSVLFQLAALSFLVIVLTNMPGLGGFGGREIVFLFGMTAACLGGSELFFNHVWLLPQYIVAGDLDRLLTYPVRTLPFFLVTRPELHAFGNLATGAAYVAGSLWLLDAPWHVWLTLPLYWVCGVLLYTSALVIAGSLSFRFVGPFAHQLLIPLNLLQATRYPLSIYPSWLRGLLLFAIPYGTIHYLPASFALGKTTSLVSLVAAPVATALFVFLAHRAWNAGLRSYESTGS